MANIEFKDIVERREAGDAAPVGTEILPVQTNPDDPDVADRPYQAWTWLYVVEKVKAAIGDATTSVSGLLSASDKTKLNAQSNTNTGDETTATIKTKLGAASNIADGYLLSSDWSLFDNKQDALVSATNIKTINGSSILGSGDLSVSGGSFTSSSQAQGEAAASNTAVNTPTTLDTTTGIVPNVLFYFLAKLLDTAKTWTKEQTFTLGIKLSNLTGDSNKYVRVNSSTKAVEEFQLINDFARSRTEINSSEMSFINQNRFIVGQGIVINGLGDSYMFGTGATVTARGFINVYSALAGSSINNVAVGGAGILWGFKQATTYSSSILSVQNTHPYIIQLGFNDVTRTSNNARTFTKLQDGYRALLAKILLYSATAASDAAITKIGTWSAKTVTTDHPTMAESISGIAMYSSVNGDKLSFTVTSGRKTVIGYLTNDTAQTAETWGTFEVRIQSTGFVLATIDTNNRTIWCNPSDPTIAYPVSHYDNEISVGAVVIDGIGTASTVIDIVNTSSNKVHIDYIGSLLLPSESPDILINSIPKINATGYGFTSGGSPRPFVASDAIIDQATTSIQSILGDFYGYPISFVDVNLYRQDSYLAADNIHDSDENHRLAAKAMYEKTRTLKTYTIAPSGPKNLFVKKATSATITHTGTTVETIKYTEEILTIISPYDVLRFAINWGATNTGPAKQLKVYINSSPDLTGSPVQLGLHQVTVNAGVGTMSRKIKVLNTIASQLLFGNPAVSATNEYAAFPDAPYSLAIDFSTPKYFVITATLSNSTDTISIYDIEGEINR